MNTGVWFWKRHRLPVELRLQTGPARLRLTGSPCSGPQPPATRGESGGTVWGLFVSLRLPLRATCPVFFLHSLLQAWPSPCKRFLAQDACRGDRICSLRSGVGRAFPTLRVWEAAPERGAVAARAWTCPCGLGHGLGTRPGSQAPPLLPPLFIMRKEMGHTQLP